MKLAFVFGKNWRLSLAEILAYFETEAVHFDFVDLTENALVMDANVDPAAAISDLGGTLKIVEIEKEFDFTALQEQKLDLDINISFYGDKKLLPRVRKVFNRLPRGGIIASVDLIKKRIDEHALVFGLKTCYFGKTIAVSNPFDFQHRDIGRPVQRPELSISPSRARILVNLSKARTNLLDPFCGVGTIGQEALLRGVKTVYLSDIDKNCVAATQKNMRWLGKKTAIVQRCDARKLQERYAGISAIATEPELGPKLRRRPSKSDAEKIVKYLAPLYIEFFKSAAHVLKKGSRVAIVLPCINSVRGKVFMKKYFPRFQLIDPFSSVPAQFREYLGIKRRTVLDEEREIGKERIIGREFCVYEFLGRLT